MPTDDDRLRGGQKGDARRAERLAAELRENLKRRKIQSRNRKAGDGDATTVPTVSTASPTAEVQSRPQIPDETGSGQQ